MTGLDGERRAVTEHAERGVDVIKVMASGGMTHARHRRVRHPVRCGLSSASARRGGPPGRPSGLAHAHSLAGIRHALTGGVDGIEHFTGLTADGLRLPDDLLADVAAAGVQVCPTMGADPALMPPPDKMPPGLRAAFERLGLDFPSFLASRVTAVGRMRDHGITVVTGTDAGISPAKGHGLVRFAIYQLVAGGYPVAEALATATSGAAESCGLADVTGSLRPGLAADLLVVDGDVALDVEALGRIEAVLVRGTPHTTQLMSNSLPSGSSIATA